MFHLPLENLIIEASQYAYLEFFQIAVSRQINMTDHIQKSLKKFNEDQFNAYTQSFVSNIYVLTTLIKQFPATNFSPIIKKIIGQYLNAYSEYRSDGGCTLALPQYGAGAPFHSKESMLKQNSRELKRFLTKIDATPLHSHTYGLHKSLESLNTFLSSIKEIEGELTSRNIEVLIEAIKSEDVDTIKKIALFQPGMIDKTCPMIMQADEVGLTPLMLAAKYCKHANTIEQGLFAGIKGAALRKLNIRSRSKTNDNNYNSLSIAARYGSPDVFAYFAKAMETEINTDIAISLLECICTNYLPHEKIPADKKNIPEEVVQLKSQHQLNRKKLLADLLTAILKKEENLENFFDGQTLPENTLAKLRTLSQVKKLKLAASSAPAQVAVISKRKPSNDIQSEAGIAEPVCADRIHR